MLSLFSDFSRVQGEKLSTLFLIFSDLYAVKAEAI